MVFLILAYLIRIYIFYRRKTDPTALDIYNIAQIILIITLGLIVISRGNFGLVLGILYRSPLGWFLAIYVFGILSGLWSAIPFFSTYFAFEQVVILAAIAIILNVQSDNLSNERFAIYSSYTFIAIILLGYIRASGLSLNLHQWHSNNYSTIAAMLFGYCFGEYINKYREKEKSESRMLKKGIWFSLFFTILGTSSSSNIAAMGSLLVVLIIAGKKSHKVLAFLIFIAAVIINNVDNQLFFKIIFPGKTIANVEIIGGRTALWEDYIEMIKQKPFTGWGFASISRVTKFYATHTHNTLIEIVGGIGILGLLFYIIYLFRMFYLLFRYIYSPHSLGVLAALTAGSINGFTVSFFGADAGAIFIAFATWNILGWYSIIQLHQVSESESI
jgi:O-antigen ligase